MKRIEQTFPNVASATRDLSPPQQQEQRQSNDDDRVKKLLLAFKHSSVQSDPHGYLSDWKSNSSIPFCSWRGLTCSPEGHVTTLNLSNAGLVGSFHLPNLTALPTLQHLYLQNNSFSAADLSSNNSLCRLETVDLSLNTISNPLPDQSFLQGCNHLAFVNLSHNLIPGGSLHFSPSLLQLDLSGNNISDLSLLTCQNLNLLNVSHNKLKGRLGISLLSCKNLSTLDLSYNVLSGKIPTNFLANVSAYLRYLDLSSNNFLGKLSTLDFGVCSSLSLLNLSGNTLSGKVFPASLSHCHVLETLDLSNNELQDKIPRALLGDLKKLKQLFLGRNHFVSCFSLVSLNLGRNQLSGNFLSTVVSKLPSLRYLYVPFNSITGHVPLSLTNGTRLQVLDLSANFFTGNIPPGFNSLSGPIPSEVWSLSNLSDMIMWANNLTGEIPKGICINGGNLETLILNNNLLTGSIPQSIANCNNMVWVSLSSNQLTGEIPSSFGSLLKLAILQLGNNSLSGQIPAELGKCQSLIWLDLNSNNLNGSIPSELANQAGLGGTACRGAGGLIEFEGIRAERLKSLPMVHSCPSTRIYPRLTIYTFTNSGSMIFLDISYNSLSGTIPTNLGTLSYLQVLNLGHNMLGGNIPESFGGLKAIGVLDLSHNNLLGFLPGSLETLSFLSDLDVSNNNLTGTIPSGGQLTTFPASRYENNSGLCGIPLPACGYQRPPAQSEVVPEKEKTAVSGMDVGYVSFTFFFVVTVSLSLLTPFLDLPFRILLKGFSC
ncbi:hypothetical protein ABKV19_002997 [Rosa sericea]